MWEFVLNEPEQAGFAHAVTAKCSKCGAKMFDDPTKLGFRNTKNGTVIWMGFFTHYKGARKQFADFALESAEQVRHLLPKYCATCGRMMVNDGH